MFASNFPMDKVSVSFEDLYDAFFQLASGFSEGEKQQLFRRNAVGFYGVRDS